MIELGKDNLELAYICTKNRVRSPAAELITNTEARKRGLTGIRATSAGLSWSSHNYMRPDMQIALIILGYQLAPHRTQLATIKYLLWKDHIFCMREEHVEAVLGMFRPAERKYMKSIVCTLGEQATGEKVDIPDPGSFIFKHRLYLPWLVPSYTIRKGIYKILGKVDPGDEKAVLDVHIMTAKTIEAYCQQVLDQIQAAREQKAK